MSEPVAENPRKAPRGAIIAVALMGAAVAIAIGVWVGNGSTPQAADCVPQPGAAAKIDAAAVGQLAALNGTGTGRNYADLAFTDTDGKPVTLADFAGKTLLINFWASWCVPCRAEMPALDKLAAAENDENFMVLPINLDMGEGGRDKAKAFLAEGGWQNLPLYADSSFAAFKRLQTTGVAIGLPASILVDGKGCEIGVLQGPAEWETPDGINVVTALKSL